MRRSFVLRWLAPLMGLALLTGAMTGCVTAMIPEPCRSADASVEDWDEMVIAVFAMGSDFSDATLEEMWAVEDEAQAALDCAGMGLVDGTGSGMDEYSLYFYGSDRAALWELLEPIMRTAPLELTRAELWPAGDTADPEIIDLSE